MIRIDKLETSLDLMGGGAWPFLVLGVICLLNCDNGRDLNLLNRRANVSWLRLLRGTMGNNPMEV